MALIDLRDSVILIQDGTTNQLEIKIGQGNLTHSEKRQLDFVLSRGALDTVRENEDQPMEVAFSFMWEFLKSAAGEAISPEEAIKGIGAASSWTSSNPDPKAPFSVNIIVIHTPPCAGVDIETVLLPQFNQENLAHSLNDATVACSGKCNATQAIITRTPQT